MAASPTGEPSTSPPWSRASWPYAAREIVLIVFAYFLYFLVRGLTEGSPERAFINAADVIDIEERLGVAWEHEMQGWITGSQTMMALMNWVYIYGHWPVIAVVAFWLLIWHPREYQVVRNAFLISGGIGLIVFATYPVAPPRLLDIGLVDTVTEQSRVYRVLQPPALVNQYAAIPSLHFGWNLLIGIVLVWVARAPAARVFGLVMPPLMFLSIVMTANHFVIDGILGAAVALLGLGLALWLRKVNASALLRSDRLRRALRV